MNGLAVYLPSYRWLVVAFHSCSSFGERRLGSFRDLPIAQMMNRRIRRLKRKDLQIGEIGGQVGLRRFMMKSGVVEGWGFRSWALNMCGG